MDFRSHGRLGQEEARAVPVGARGPEISPCAAGPLRKAPQAWRRPVTDVFLSTQLITPRAGVRRLSSRGSRSLLRRPRIIAAPPPTRPAWRRGSTVPGPGPL